MACQEDRGEPHRRRVSTRGRTPSVRRLMDAHAPGLDDPQLGTEFSLLEKGDQVPNSGQHGVRFGARGNLENDYPGGPRGREAQHMTEVVVERYERPCLRGAHHEELFVRRTDQPFVPGSSDVMSFSAKELRAALAEVLVEFESQATSAVGTGMIRSRVASAP